jgi:hypothetical protein
MSIDIEFDAWQRNHFASIMAHMRAAGNNDPVLSGMIQSAIKGAWLAARATPLAPTPAAAEGQAEGELARIKRMAVCGTVDSFLSLPEQDKRYWFAMCLDESERRKKAEERLAFLHSANKDAEGYEFGVARAKFDAAGSMESFLWALSDHSDLDRAIAHADSGAAPLPRQAAVEGEFSAHPDRIIQQANEVRDAARYQLARAVYGATARLIPGPMYMAETPEQFDAAVDQIRAYRAAAKPANSGEA